MSAEEVQQLLKRKFTVKIVTKSRLNFSSSVTIRDGHMKAPELKPLCYGRSAMSCQWIKSRV